MASQESEEDPFADARKWKTPSRKSSPPADGDSRVMPAASSDATPPEATPGDDATRPMPVPEATRIEAANHAPAEELTRVPAPARPTPFRRRSPGVWLAAAAALAALVYLFLAR